MDLSAMNSEKVRKRWEQQHNIEINIIRKNSTNQNLKYRARIHGYLCGDGSVSIRKENNSSRVHHDMFFYPDDEQMLVSFSEAFVKIYEKKPSIRKFNKYFRLAVSSKPIVLDLLKEGSFSSKAWYIPFWIQNNKIFAKEWLRAFFDSEAYVGINDIRLQSVNRRGLMQIRAILHSFGIESKTYVYKRPNPNWGINYHLSIPKNHSRNEFINIIGFNHSRKMDKCQGRIIR